jgi:hypothetical protein
MNLQEHIRKVLNEETDQVEDKKSNLKTKLKNIADEFGLEDAVKMIGGIENYIKIFFNGDLKNFYKESGLEPYYISSEPNLYIDDAVVQILDLPDFNFSRRGEKDLGTFKWTRSGMSYRFKAVIHPITYEGGNKMWRVIGTSGDSGFGYSWITKRNTLGKRARTQIFKQIIDKYNLDRLT